MRAAGFIKRQFAVGWSLLPLAPTQGATTKSVVVAGSPRALLYIEQAEKKATRLPDCFVHYAVEMLDPPVLPLRVHELFAGPRDPPCLDVPPMPIRVSDVRVLTTPGFVDQLLAVIARNAAAEIGAAPTTSPTLVRMLLRVTPHSGIVPFAGATEVALTLSRDGAWTFDGDAVIKALPATDEAVLVFQVEAEVAFDVPATSSFLADVRMVRSVVAGWHAVRPHALGEAYRCVSISTCWPRRRAPSTTLWSSRAWPQRSRVCCVVVQDVTRSFVEFCFCLSCVVCASCNAQLRVGRRTIRQPLRRRCSAARASSSH